MAATVISDSPGTTSLSDERSGNGTSGNDPSPWNTTTDLAPDIPSHHHPHLTGSAPPRDDVLTSTTTTTTRMRYLLDLEDDLPQTQVLRAAVWMLAGVGILGNAGLLVAGFCRRRKRNHVHAVLVVNLGAASLLTALHLLVLSLQSLLPHFVPGYPVPAHICTIAAFLQHMGYEAYMGFLLLTAINEAWSEKNPFVRYIFAPCKVILLSSAIWLVSALVALVPLLLPAANSSQEIFALDNSICSYIHLLVSVERGWEYVLSVHLGLNLGLFITVVVMHCLAIYWMVRNKKLARTLRGRHESYFMYKSFVVTYTSIAYWVPSLLLVNDAILVHTGHQPSQSNYTKHWVALLSMSVHVALTPALWTAMALTCKKGRPTLRPVKEDTCTPSKKDEVWVSHTHRQVSVRLSSYLESGQTLNERDAFVMTATLSEAINSFHRKGMAASVIDPDHILVQQDHVGNLVDTHLICVPMTPRRSSLEDHKTEDKDAIGDIFDSVMAHIKENKMSSGGQRSKSVRLLKTLSVRGGASMRRSRSTYNGPQRDRAKTFKY